MRFVHRTRGFQSGQSRSWLETEDQDGEVADGQAVHETNVFGLHSVG